MNKTKLYTIIILMIMVVLSTIGAVNAATTKTTNVSVKADKTTVETGDEVTITIHSSEKTTGADFKVEWDKKFLEYVKSEAMGKNVNTGKFEFVNTDGTNDFTLTFKVIGTEGSDTVKVTPEKIANGTSEKYDVKITNSSVKLNIKEEPKQEEPKQEEPKQEEPKQEEPKAEETKPANKKPAKNKIPQAGFNAAPVLAVIALVTVAGATFAVKKAKK